MKEIQLEQCIHEYGKDIYALCSRLTRSTQEAEDLYQDTFLKVVELGDKIDYEQNPKSYMVSIALRIWKNRKRKYAWRKRIAGMEQLTEEAVSSETVGQGDSAEEEFLQKELKEQVIEAVSGLEDRYRIPVYLYYTLQLPVEQIGKIMKLPQGTIKSRLYKARKLLKQKLEVVLNEA